jgi:transglutaminase-like putative cysteine protease
MYQAAAVVPNPDRRIDDPASVDFLRLSVNGVDLDALDLRGAGQSVQGDSVELRDAEFLPPAAPDADLPALLAPEPFIESDAPEIVAEARSALKDIVGERARAERLVRHVNAMIEKRPTVSLPSALEVLRTRVGDCNEHTALFVALARAAGIPARIAVGLVYLRGAFYYHAWSEVWLPAKAGSGRWIPVDPTLNQFPADLTHLRLARGGLDKQATILTVMGRIKVGILEVKLKPGTAPVLVGRQAQDKKEIAIDLPVRDGSSGLSCWSKPK